MSDAADLRAASSSRHALLDCFAYLGPAPAPLRRRETREKRIILLLFTDSTEREKHCSISSPACSVSLAVSSVNLVSIFIIAEGNFLVKITCCFEKRSAASKIPCAIKKIQYHFKNIVPLCQIGAIDRRPRQAGW